MQKKNSDKQEKYKQQQLKRYKINRAQLQAVNKTGNHRNRYGK